MGWRGTSANGTWEDSLVHVIQVATHSVGACHCMSVVLNWASTNCTGVVVINITTMDGTVVPVLLPLFC
jgi:hypothetical protein